MSIKLNCRRALKLNLGCVLAAAFFGSAVFAQNLHPGFNLYTIHPNNFQPPGIGGMAFLPNDDLALVAWGGNDRAQGQLWIVSGVVGAQNPTGVTTRQLASGLREPLGLKYVNNQLYILEKPRIARVVDQSGTGNYTGSVQIQTFYDGWDEDNVDWHDFSFGFVYKDDAFYFNTGLYPPNTGGPGLERGAMLRVDISNPNNVSHSIFVGGMRNASGAGLGPEGEIFSTDNQGAWLPNSKLVHQVQGRFYGMKKANDNVMDAAFEAKGETPPVLWIQQGDAGQSPTEPFWLTSGRFAGQFLIGDEAYGGIKRAFVEKVNGEYQGALFRFIESSALEAGPNRMEYGPDGAIYIGYIGGGTNNLGGSGNWHWNNTWTGLQRLVENNNDVFEILAVRSISNGFEIEFTKPHGNGAGSQGNYFLERWGINPQYGYGGGNRENRRNVSVQSLQVVNSTTVRLQVSSSDLQHGSGILPSTVFHMTVSNVSAQDGQSMRFGEAWYTLNSVGPADILGCQNPNFQEYNAQADYDDGIQCQTPVTGLIPLSKGRLQGIAVEPGVVKVTLEGNYQLDIFNLAGEQIQSINGRGQQKYSLTGIKQAGVYLIRARTVKGLHREKVLLQP